MPFRVIDYLMQLQVEQDFSLSNIFLDFKCSSHGLRLTKLWALGFLCFEFLFLSYLKHNKTWFIISKFLYDRVYMNCKNNTWALVKLQILINKVSP